MDRKNPPIYIQPDARGRIQLPKQLRAFPLFKLGENAEGYQLIPLKVVGENPAEPTSVWLTAEVNLFLAEVLLPKLRAYLSSHPIPHLEAAFLYGSRARGDALSRSDFDFGLLVESYPNSQERNSVSDTLQAALKAEFETLRTHGVDAEFSFHFFSSNLTPEAISPVYFSIVTDGQLIWQQRGRWGIFTEAMRRHMQAKRVVAVGDGKKRQWKWETK